MDVWSITSMDVRKWNLCNNKNTLSPLKWNKSTSLRPIPRYLFGFLSTIPMDQEVPGNETMKHSGIIQHSWLEVMDPLDWVDGISQKKTWRYSSHRYVIGSLPEGRSFIWEIHCSISSLNIFWVEWPRSLRANAPTTNGWLKDVLLS